MYVYDMNAIYTNYVKKSIIIQILSRYRFNRTDKNLKNVIIVPHWVDENIAQDHRITRAKDLFRKYQF